MKPHRHKRIILFHWVAIILCVVMPGRIFAQPASVIQSIIAGGTTSGAASNTKVQLVGSVGQPLANSNSTSGYYTIAFLLTTDIDSVPPVISLSVGKSIIRGNAQPLAPVITDNFFNQISEAKLHFRAIGTKNMTSTDLVRNGTTTTFSASIEASAFDAMGIEFYLTAKDLTGNEARYPKDEGRLYVYVTDKSTIPASLLSFGAEQKNYRMISVPFNFQENISKLLDEFGGNDVAQWRLKTYGGGDTFLEYPSDFSTFERARGYWLIARQSKELVLSESVQAPENNQADLFKMMLQPGWNQIGNPYTLPINWEDVRNYNANEPIGKLKLYDGTGADNGYYNGDASRDFQAYQGGFVYYDGTAAAQILIPFKGQTSGGRTEGGVAEGWQLPIEITDGNVVNRLGGIGMHAGALATKDRFDDHNPPRFLDFAEINFSHPEHPLKSFCFDVVPEAEEYVWSFTVSSSSGKAELRWPSIDLKGKELFLYDEGAGQIIDMQAEHIYAAHSESGTLKIYYGIHVTDKIRPESVQVGIPFPNPFQTEVNIPFALPGNNERFDVTVDVFNAMGQRVRNIAAGVYASGLHTVRWNGESEDMQPGAAGLYFYRVRVSKDGKDFVKNGRILKQN